MQTTKEKKYLKDKVASILFTDDACREYVECIVSSATGIEPNKIKDNLVLISPRINTNVNIKYNYVDAIYENDDSVINIEINYNNSKYTQNKNMNYICHLILKQTDIGEIPNLKKIYQININNFDIFNKNKFIYHSYLMEVETHEKRDDIISIIDINVDFLSNIDYNNIKEDKDSLEYLLYIFVNDNKNELDKLYLNNKVMEKVRDKLSALSDDFLEGLYYDHEELAKKASFDIGKTEGIKERNIEIAKALIAEGDTVDKIAKVTGLAIEEVIKLQDKS